MMVRTAKRRFSVSAGFRKKTGDMVIATAIRTNRSEHFMYSSPAVWLPMTSRGVRYQWFLSTNQISNPFPTGKEGTYIVGSIELTITEANGIYGGFAGGHNTMVDILHQLPNGTFVEHCICIINRPKA